MNEASSEDSKVSKVHGLQSNSACYYFLNPLTYLKSAHQAKEIVFLIDIAYRLVLICTICKFIVHIHIELNQLL